MFKRNFIESAIIELRYPTYLRLKDQEPLEISESIRERFPIYNPQKQMQMTPLGSTDHQKVYTFATRQQDPVLDILASSLSLTTKRYTSFDNFLSHAGFLIENVVPHLETTFFTRVGLRYINRIDGLQPDGTDVNEWVNANLVSSITGERLGVVTNMNSELTGHFNTGSYTFRYGILPPANSSRFFILDWDYYCEDVEVPDCISLLKSFHELHYPFFWWTLGDKAKEALLQNAALNA